MEGDSTRKAYLREILSEYNAIFNEETEKDLDMGLEWRTECRDRMRRWYKKVRKETVRFGKT